MLDNTSAPSSLNWLRPLPRDLKIPFAHAAIAALDADSGSFKERGIPALTIHGMSRDWSTVLHTSKDQAAKAIPAQRLSGLPDCFGTSYVWILPAAPLSGGKGFRGAPAKHWPALFMQASRPIRNVLRL